MTLVGLMALSRGDQDKPADPNSRAISASCAVPKVLFLMASLGLAFHHGDVLVSRGVEDHFRRETLENVVHPLGRPGYLPPRADADAAITGFIELLFDGEELHFGLVDEEQALRIEGRDLAAELAADAAAGAR